MSHDVIDLFHLQRVIFHNRTKEKIGQVQLKNFVEDSLESPVQSFGIFLEIIVRHVRHFHLDKLVHVALFDVLEVRYKVFVMAVDLGLHGADFTLKPGNLSGRG